MVIEIQKIENLVFLANAIKSRKGPLNTLMDKALQLNAWFTKENIDIAINAIINNYLDKDLLSKWLSSYQLPTKICTVGIVMAGNIPLVGFHDFLCAYIVGHKANIKLSSKDALLLPYMVDILAEHDPDIKNQIQFKEQLRNCDAYIATGSNNSSRYFEQYFSKYPNIIRKNRTSVAVLDGTETIEQLHDLAKDIFTYYGLGCRNVTQLYLPQGYDFTLLFKAIEPYRNFQNFHKYANNYDYNLALYLLNNIPYITNDFLLLIENSQPFSAVSVLHYQYYQSIKDCYSSVSNNNNIQCIVGNEHTAFGLAQEPQLNDYADGIDTMLFLCNLK